MVEKKSVASLANTSFIVVLRVGASRHGEEQSDEAIQSCTGYGAAGLLLCARNDVLYGAPALCRRLCILCPPAFPTPLAQIHRGPSRGESNPTTAASRPAR